jgi:transposase
VPRPYPPEFRQRAIELARSGTIPVSQVARDLGIADSCLRNWLRQDDIDRGRKEGLTTSERQELIDLRRKLRVAEMEVEILRRAAAFFAKDSLPRPK